ncbi:MAG: hypothetical protein BWY89_01981 [Bacteroidetes bacterium ADurb.BinA012]|nr:MAG: hypothetical protein BWY89_01981 [Bacteroidetes bacterium ADurb.BinA012]
MAIRAARKPKKRLRSRNGFRINDLFAPISCIVFIRNLFEYIERRIVLFMIVRAIRNSRKLITSRKTLILRKLSLIRFRKDSW